MEDINVFLAHAVELEREAARRYEELADSMRTDGNAAVEKFFRKMAVFSRKHLALAMERGGFRQLPVLAAEGYSWPDGISPEQFDWIGVDCMIDVNNALDLALDGERRGHAFYADIASTTGDPEVRMMAQEFAAEEAEHVAELEKWIGRYAPQTANPPLAPGSNHAGIK
ncbi:observed by proteomics Citation: proteomics from VerBerkmoes et al. (2003) unpublished [Sulfuriferula multivorans]|uniref:Observed by proteomics Citation: proteomics from VerBerkmoes et al. (2003) unpublished n=1 Tax=Sulfuriferula multivorans TaxID=1559896 RepID=A0A401JC95_9PROT|nr:ferritin family protein [Sulfuriferula multivorans]GBL45186.1 observed by proteomics Citation: proteomics from VerBerkmoes et al. (2003) unpublished [Sulfuriferula multivorans]